MVIYNGKNINTIYQGNRLVDSVLINNNRVVTGSIPIDVLRISPLNGNKNTFVYFYSITENQSIEVSYDGKKWNTVNVNDSVYLRRTITIPAHGNAPAHGITVAASIYIRGTGIGDYDSNTNIRIGGGEAKISGRLTSLIGDGDLTPYCFQYLFALSSTLADASELILPFYVTEGCYYRMFRGCTSLTSAPALPATTLAASCYKNMFEGCTSLNYIKCLATNISANDCTKDWTYEVADYGTFVKASNMNNWERGNNGIPYAWTVENT